LLHDFPARGNLKKLWRIMRLSFVFIFIFGITVSAKSYSQAKKMDINLANSTIGEVMKYVEKNSEFVFLYRNEDIDLQRKVDVNLSNATIDQEHNFRGNEEFQRMAFS